MTVYHVVLWVADAVVLVGLALVFHLVRRLRAERRAVEQLRRSIGEPVAYRRADGHVTVEWPDESTRFCLVARELLDSIVEELNEARGVS